MNSRMLRCQRGPLLSLWLGLVLVASAATAAAAPASTAPAARAAASSAGGPLSADGSRRVLAYWHSAAAADNALAVLTRDPRLVSARREGLDHLGGVLVVFQLHTPAEALGFRSRLRAEFPGLAADLEIRYGALQPPAPAPH
jgi:hypothetical protein